MHADLDNQLLLETKYNYVEKLRQTQAEMDTSGTIVVDQLTIARNHVLVNAELFGGAQEKFIPSWTVSDNDPKLLTSMPLFAGSMPLPEEYVKKVNYGATTNTKTGANDADDRSHYSFSPSSEFFSEETELHRLVRSSRPDRLDDRWLSKCRHLFMNTVRQSNPESIPHSRK